jgi:hypothetical protein
MLHFLDNTLESHVTQNILIFYYLCLLRYLESFSVIDPLNLYIREISVQIIVMLLRIEILDSNEENDWVNYQELPLVQWHSEDFGIIEELFVAYGHSVVLPNGESLEVSAHAGKYDGVWIMVEERGTHKASVDALSNDPPPKFIFTTYKDIDVRLTVVK